MIAIYAELRRLANYETPLPTWFEVCIVRYGWLGAVDSLAHCCSRPKSLSSSCPLDTRPAQLRDVVYQGPGWDRVVYILTSGLAFPNEPLDGIIATSSPLDRAKTSEVAKFILRVAQVIAMLHPVKHSLLPEPIASIPVGTAFRQFLNGTVQRPDQWSDTVAAAVAAGIPPVPLPAAIGRSGAFLRHGIPHALPGSIHPICC
jgi:hypothetical protein